MTISKWILIICSSVLTLIPAVVLFRDWKHYDKRTKVYRWITRIILSFWVSAAFGVGWVMWMDFSHNEKPPSLIFYLNNTRIFQDAVVTLPWTNGILELQITILNDGQVSADGFNAEVVFPDELPIVDASGWQQTSTMIIAGDSLKSVRSRRYFCAGENIIRPKNIVPLPTLSLQCSNLESSKFSVSIFATTKNAPSFGVWSYVRFQRDIHEVYIEKGLPGGTLFGIFPR